MTKKTPETGSIIQLKSYFRVESRDDSQTPAMLTLSLSSLYNDEVGSSIHPYHLIEGVNEHNFEICGSLLENDFIITETFRDMVTLRESNADKEIKVGGIVAKVPVQDLTVFLNEYSN